jgi:hypothetical protein
MYLCLCSSIRKAATQTISVRAMRLESAKALLSFAHSSSLTCTSRTMYMPQAADRTPAVTSQDTLAVTARALIRHDSADEHSRQDLSSYKLN